MIVDLQFMDVSSQLLQDLAAAYMSLCMCRLVDASGSGFRMARLWICSLWLDGHSASEINCTRVLP